ncbi:helix-turn-helix transcriptional regulator [Vibrio salinus]|uniref:helix-turn-helix transcriptional regulator n=1 Tax=Vibrio salinus TaxID=2899784 RepID=UPI001E490BE5|nr:AraC family transcriptional regulator [Vibrio salinus]MCE0494988.1 AraC family transcriptional regulator [Vibrio salinus]
MKPIPTKTLIRPGYSWRHYFDISTTALTQRHFHREYELLLLFNYQGMITVGSVDIEVFPCSFILIPPNIPHDLRGLTLNIKGKLPERHCLWIEKEWMSHMLVHCSEMRKLANVFGNKNKGILFSQQAAFEAKDVINQIDYNTSSLEQLSVLFRVFSLITQDKGQIRLSSLQSDFFECEKDRVEALSQYIDKNYSKDISLSDLSNHVYCSERTVNRIFKKHFGETFSQRLKKIRLSHAANLLETSSLNVSHICHCVGYNNISNFNRLFKAYKGLTPVEYRTKFSN